MINWFFYFDKKQSTSKLFEVVGIKEWSKKQYWQEN
jgi:hypothetical protein